MTSDGGLTQGWASKPFGKSVLKMMRDYEILSRIKEHEKEIERIGSEMIAGVEKDSVEEIEILRQEIKNLKEKVARDT